MSKYALEAEDRGLSQAELAHASEALERISEAYAAIVVGQDSLRRSLLIAMLANRHILLESVPGLAKTLAVHTLASTTSAQFSRVQCTPDLLPSDLVGTQIYLPSTGEFRTELGPIHANFVLLDEINRSSAKTQSAMLEAMQERQVTIGGQTYPMPSPFLVLATQNPLDEEGTHVLPQAQMDRFLLKEVITYPSAPDELEVLRRTRQGIFDAGSPRAVATTQEVRELQDFARRVYVDESLMRYVIELINVTRDPARYLTGDMAGYIEEGASPRASIGFIEAAAALALIRGRSYVTTDDIVSLRHSVLRHRLLLTFEARALRVKVEDIIDAIVDAVPAP